MIQSFLLALLVQATRGELRSTHLDDITLRNQSGITNRVEQGATGNSRIIRLDTPQLSLNDSRLSAATDGTGQAGDVVVQDADSISLLNSTISTQIQNNGVVPRSTSQRRHNSATIVRAISASIQALSASTTAKLPPVLTDAAAQAALGLAMPNPSNLTMTAASRLKFSGQVVAEAAMLPSAPTC